MAGISLKFVHNSDYLSLYDLLATWSRKSKIRREDTYGKPKS